MIRSLPLILPALVHAAELPKPEWKELSTGHAFAEGLAVAADGTLYFTDVPDSELYRLDPKNGERTLVDEATGKTNGLALGPGGRLFGAANGARAIHRWDPADWSRRSVARGTSSNDLCVRDDGTIFYTDPDPQTVWRVDPKGELAEAATLDWRPNGIALSPDQKTLLVAEFRADTVHAFTVGKDGELDGPRPAYRLQVPDNGEGRLDGMQVLEDRTLLIGTQLGLQVAWPLEEGKPARSRLIPADKERPRCNYVRLSPDRQWLYAAYVEAVLRCPLEPAWLKPSPR